MYRDLCMCFRTHCPRNSYVSRNMVNTWLRLPSSHASFTTPLQHSPSSPLPVLQSPLFPLLYLIFSPLCFAPSLAVISHIPLFLAEVTNFFTFQPFSSPCVLSLYLHTSPSLFLFLPPSISFATLSNTISCFCK